MADGILFYEQSVPEQRRSPAVQYHYAHLLAQRGDTTDAVQLYRARVADARVSAAGGATAHLATAHLEGAYYGLWALALWVIFGTYVLVLWVIGAVAYAIFRMVPRRGPA